MINRRKFLTQTGLSLMALPVAFRGFAEYNNDECSIQFIGTPCRNFNILATTTIVDPIDNRSKFVLSNFAARETGSIVIIDPETGKGEHFVLPKGAGAWGLVNWHNEKLIIGTCTVQAYLHVFDLAKREFVETIEADGEIYFWQMGLGSDDKIYGGTFQGCALTRYDPKTNVFENLGRVSDNPKNLYTTHVNCNAPGYVLVWYGFDKKGVKVYDIAKGTFADIGHPDDKIKEANPKFICLENEGKFSFYDAVSLEPIESREKELANETIKIQNGEAIPYKELGNNKITGVRGQDYFITSLPSDKEERLKPVSIELKRIPVEALPTNIHTIVFDKNGKLWGACGFGQTIFSFDPDTKEYWNSSTVCNNGGEVYGMVYTKDKLYLSAYAGGDHVVYDPSQPWNQLENKNPVTLTAVAPALIRPFGRSVLGPDGNVWTGWWGYYGVYGGGLSCINTDTNEVQHWYDPIPHQAVSGVAADKGYVYFTTNGQANGLPYNNEVRCHFVVWKPGKGIVHDIEMGKGEMLNQAIVASGGKVAMGMKDKVLIFDAKKRKITHTIDLNTGKDCFWMISIKEGLIGVFCDNKYCEINTEKGTRTELCTLPGNDAMAAVSPKGEVYFSIRSKLYLLNRKRQ